MQLAAITSETKSLGQIGYLSTHWFLRAKWIAVNDRRIVCYKPGFIFTIEDARVDSIMHIVNHGSVGSAFKRLGARVHMFPVIAALLIKVSRNISSLLS